MVGAGVNAQDVRRIFGDVDEKLLVRIVQTGASMAEIGEALDSIEAEQDAERIQPISSSRVADVRAIVASMLWPDGHHYGLPTVEART